MAADVIANVIDKDVNLQHLNTLAVPAVARWYALIDTVAQLPGLIDFYHRRGCALLVLGSGSNTVLPEYFDGLLLHNALRGRFVEAETDTCVSVSIAAGESWHNSVLWAVANQWYGIENLALIPGTVGAAPVQNIGAYGVELADCFAYLEGVCLDTGQTLRLSREQCQFAYRRSIFKGELQDKLLITRVVLTLQKQACLQLHYPSLKQALLRENLTQPTLAQVAAAVIAIRQSKLPDPETLPNAGSFFKNPVVNQALYTNLKQTFPDIVAYPQGQGTYKLAAGWLVEHAGWRGRLVDGIAMYKAQALVLTNPARKPAKQLLDFAAQVQASVYKQFAVSLEIEPRIVHCATS